MDPIALQQNACEAAQLMKALSNPHRLAILCCLLEGEKSVGHLVPLIGLVAFLAMEVGMDVRTRRVAQTIYYALDGTHAHAVLDTLHRLYCRDDAAAGREAALASARVAPRLDA